MAQRLWDGIAQEVKRVRHPEPRRQRQSGSARGNPQKGVGHTNIACAPIGLGVRSLARARDDSRAVCAK